MTIAEPTEEPARQSAQIAGHSADAEPDNAGDDVLGEAEDEGYTWHTLAAFISPGALAVSAFTLAASGLMVLLGPLALISSFSLQTPVESAQHLAYIGIGIGVVAIALALWSLLRPESGPAWPRVVAGAAGVVALMVIFQYTVVLVMAANTPADTLVQ